MATQATARKRSQGLGSGQAINYYNPSQIVSNRAPTSADRAEVGTFWFDTVGNTVYARASNSGWTTSPASGVGLFTDVTITGGGTALDVQAGNVVIGVGDLDVTSGNVTIGGNLDVTGDMTVSGDFDITSASALSFTTTSNTDPAISFTTNGGAAETIIFTNTQGTAADAIDLEAVAGGIKLFAGGAAMSIQAANQTMSLVTGTGTLNLGADAVAHTINIGNLIGASAVSIASGTGDIDLASVDAIRVLATGLLTLQSTRNNAQAVLIESTLGGIDILASGAGAGEDIDIIATGSSVNVTSTENAAQAIYLHANGGVTETIQLHADQGTAVNSINILSDVGGITLTATGLASADAINLEAPAGGLDVNVALQMNLDSAQAAADAIRIISSDANGGIDIDAGLGGITIDSTASVSLIGAALSNFSVIGAGIDLELESAAGRVVINGEEAAADAVRILSAAGGLDVNVALQMNLDSSQAAATAVRVIASNAAGGIDVDAGTGGITIDTTGALSLDSAAASNFTVTGAFDLTLSSSAGSIVVTGAEAAVDAVQLNASNAAGGLDLNAGTGGITLDSTGAISIDAAAASNVTVTGAFDLTVASSAGSVVISGGEAANDAIQLTAAAGGVAISSSGNVSMAPATATVASPTASSTTNARVGRVIFTGFTTASAASQTFTITNSTVAATSGLFVTVSHVKNVNANVRLTLEDVEIAAAGGSFLVKVTNNGADSLDGNVIISWWCIS